MQRSHCIFVITLGGDGAFTELWVTTASSCPMFFFCECLHIFYVRNVRLFENISCAQTKYLQNWCFIIQLIVILRNPFFYLRASLEYPTHIVAAQSSLKEPSCYNSFSWNWLAQYWHNSTPNGYKHTRNMQLVVHETCRSTHILGTSRSIIWRRDLLSVCARRMTIVNWRMTIINRGFDH